MNWMTLAAEGLAEHASLAQFTVDGEPVKGALPALERSLAARALDRCRQRRTEPS